MDVGHSVVGRYRTSRGHAQLILLRLSDNQLYSRHMDDLAEPSLNKDVQLLPSLCTTLHLTGSVNLGHRAVESSTRHWIHFRELLPGESCRCVFSVSNTCSGWLVDNLAAAPGLWGFL